MTNEMTIDSQLSSGVDTSGLEQMKENKQQSGRFSRAILNIKQFATVSEIMRVLGAIIMVASMSMFLVQGWTEQNDVQRYLKLLTQSGLLAGAGLLLSLVLKEYRGARMFFGLSLVSVPANFTVIGALIFSLFNVQNITQGLPSFAKWTIIDGSSIVLVAIGAFALLLPVVWFAFRIMARRSAGKLTVAFMVLNMALLVPVRSGLTLTAIFFVAASVAFFYQRLLIKQDDTLTTPGGIFSRCMLFVPALLVFFRSTGFYAFEPILTIVGALCVYFISRQMAKEAGDSRLASITLRLVQATAGFITAFFSIGIFGGSTYEIAANLVVTSILLIAFMLDYRSIHHKKLANTIVILIALKLAAFNILCTIFEPANMLITTSALATGLYFIFYGIGFKSKLMSIAGSLIILVTSYTLVTNFAQLLMQSGWIGLGITGGVVILGASLLDRYGATVKLYLTKKSEVN